MVARKRRRRKVLREPEEEWEEVEPSATSGAGLVVLFITFTLVAGILYFLYSSKQEERKSRSRRANPPPTRRPPRTTGKSYRSEATVRAILESVFGVTFPSTRAVEWLRNPRTGRALEFDCYNESLGIALEHNGEQHERITSFTPTQAALDDLQYRDGIKDTLAPQYGVVLLRTGYRTNELGEVVYDRDLREAVYREIREKLPQYAYLIPT